MSASGHSRRFWSAEPMSALLPATTKKTDMSACPQGACHEETSRPLPRRLAVGIWLFESRGIGEPHETVAPSTSPSDNRCCSALGRFAHRKGANAQFPVLDAELSDEPFKTW